MRLWATDFGLVILCLLGVLWSLIRQINSSSSLISGERSIIFLARNDDPINLYRIRHDQSLILDSPTKTFVFIGKWQLSYELDEIAQRGLAGHLHSQFTRRNLGDPEYIDSADTIVMAQSTGSWLIAPFGNIEALAEQVGAVTLDWWVRGYEPTAS